MRFPLKKTLSLVVFLETGFSFRVSNVFLCVCVHARDFFVFFLSAELLSDSSLKTLSIEEF